VRSQVPRRTLGEVDQRRLGRAVRRVSLRTDLTGNRSQEQHGSRPRPHQRVGWRDPAGKRCCESCGPGSEGKRLATKKAEKINAQLITGTYEDKSRKTWEEFLEEYENKILVRKAVRSKDEALSSLAHFQRLIKPVRVWHISTRDIDRFAALRRQEKGKKKGDTVSAATVNKDLRHLKAALRRAKKWSYLKDVPEFTFEREGRKLVRYITGEHFAAIYAACDKARMPERMPYPAADWWRGIIVMAYMTGWRIGDLLAFRRNDLDLEVGTAITRFEDNKGKRDDRVKLHPVVVEHLRRLASFDPCVFPWNHDRRTLDEEFRRIQEAAKINLLCRGQHEHTPACHAYGFHDLRRAFATMNADKLTPDALQALMRHKSYQTTQVYINLTRQLDAAVASLHVPEVLRQQIGG
jgi:integrase